MNFSVMKQQIYKSMNSITKQSANGIPAETFIFKNVHLKKSIYFIYVTFAKTENDI